MPDGWGGALFSYGIYFLETVLTDCVLDNNSALYGGAIASISHFSPSCVSNMPTLTITGCSMSGNTAHVYGGAVFANYTKSLSISDSNFTSNHAYYGGGAVSFMLDVSSHSTPGIQVSTGGIQGQPAFHSAANVFNIHVCACTFDDGLSSLSSLPACFLFDVRIML